ncbi:MAG: hypothetical protein A2259_00935 [Candidatus Moranbacteria bacterium RIFOXYA2_FULL_43_15]|nr:MAG: hypothetical protein A2259_00935 [Candidatus Moranbacteria bacterium RIFOXYA2_FULL_43_15]
MNETIKRQKIINGLFDKFDKNIFEGILLVGSMSYGRNYSVTKNSDIDLIFIVKRENIDKLLSQNFFVAAEYFNIEKLGLLKRKTDGFWIDQHVDGVMINMGVYRSESFEKFCCFQKRKWKRSAEDGSGGWDKDKKYKGTNGKIYSGIINFRKNKKLYIKSYNIYAEGAFISNVFASNLLTSIVLYDKNGSVAKNINKFKFMTIKKYGAESILNILEYVFKKISENKKKEIIKNIFPTNMRKLASKLSCV